MKIISRLKTDGAKEVNAVLLDDSGEQYPVFLKSLHNTLIFPELIKSGYQLTSLPYGFILDGMRFDQLPINEYTCTPEELELMYNSIGAPVTDDELKKNLVADVSGVAEPPTKYTIFTREELLRYLDSTAVASCDDDFLPLNYFVAPEARFTIKEYKDMENDKYVKLITARRTMSLKKFHNLINFLKTIGLPANYNVQDVLDAYFAWGVDGLKFRTINRRRESSAFRLSYNTSAPAPVKDVTYGFIDRSLSQLTPLNKRNVAWTPTIPADALDEYVQDLHMGKCKLLKYTAQSRKDVTTLEGDTFTVRYDEEILLMQLRNYTSLRVVAPITAIGYIPLTLALPNNSNALYEYLLTNALAGMVANMRKPDVVVSTYDALLVSGCNPETALKYVTTGLGLNKDRSFLSSSKPSVSSSTVEELNTEINDIDIYRYLRGEKQDLTDDVNNVLDSIVNGEIALDGIGRAREMSWFTASDNASVSNEISAIHNVFDIPLRDIYDKIISAPADAKYVTFERNGISYDLSIEKDVNEVRAYRDDIQMYDANNARDCTFFTYVTYVAREVGTVDCDRHVGMEFYFVNKTKKNVQEVLQKLEDMFVDKVTSEITDVNVQTALLNFKHHFMTNRYFEVAFKGTITWPKQMGGMTESVPVELRNKAVAGLNRRIEMLAAFCNYTADTVSASTLHFNAFCTNAKITPERIIPRAGSTIRELPFYTLWYDWKGSNPAVWAQLVELGVLPNDFEAWEGRYITEHFVERDYERLFNDPDSLFYYEQFAKDEVNNYDPYLEFKSVAHPMTYLYPGLYQTEDEEFDPYADCEKLAAPREGAPIIRLGQYKDITQEDYAKYLHPYKVISKPATYIRKFTGFDAETLFIVPDAFSMIPELSEKMLTVVSRLGLIYDGSTDQQLSYHNIAQLTGPGYPVKQITGNLYLLRSANGTVWEVRI